MTGAQYGKWGREKYGLKPKKIDALEFYPDRLQELWTQIQKEQVCLSGVICLLLDAEFAALLARVAAASEDVYAVVSVKSFLCIHAELQHKCFVLLVFLK